MATNTYVALDKVTVSGSSTSTITFNSIPQTYTDLVIVGSFSTDPDQSNVILRFNNDSTNLYSQTMMAGTGSTVTTGRQSNQGRILINDATGTPIASPATYIANVMNYANTNVNKSVIARWSISLGTYPGTPAMASTYRSTTGISRIDLISFASTFVAGTTVSLYGISNAGDATPKATGGTVVDTLEESEKDYALGKIAVSKSEGMPMKKVAVKDIDGGKIADISGMELTEDEDGLHLNENRWLAPKKEDGSAKAKIGKGITSIRQQLGEVEKFVNWYSKLKTENGVKKEDYYKRTHKSLHKIKERLMNLSEKIRTL